MESLREIIAVLGRFDLKKTDYLDPNSKSQPNKYLELYNGIVERRYKNEAQAERALYGDDPGSSNFRVLKGRLREYLLGLLGYLDLNGKQYSDYQRALYSCNRDYFYAKILYRATGQRVSSKMARVAYQRALQYHIHDIALLCALLLRKHSSLEGNKRDFALYRKEVRRLEALVQAEAKAEEAGEYLHLQQRKSTGHKPGLIPEAEQYAEELAALVQEYNSYTIYINYYRVEVFCSCLTNDYRRVLKACTEAEAYFAANPEFRSSHRAAEVLTQKMTACLALRDYPAGLAIAQEALENRNEGGTNWFLTLEVYFLLAMHSLQFGKAAKLFLLAIGQKRFTMMQGYVREKWHVYESYLGFAIHSAWAGELGEVIPAAMLQRLALHREMKDTPIYSRDKKGLNTAILIAQILHLLQAGNLDEISEKMDALERYNRRYLNSPVHYRTYCFFRMLALMEHCSFDPAETARTADKWLQQLQCEHLDTGLAGEAEEAEESVAPIGPMQNGIEVLPYEVLWERIILLLKQHKT